MCQQYKFHSASFEFELRSNNLPDFRVALAIRIQLDASTYPISSAQEEDDDDDEEEEEESAHDIGQQQRPSIIVYK